MFDYEYAILQHSLNCRLASRVLVPDAIPPGRLRRFGARGRPALSATRASRRSTTWPGSSPTRTVPRRSGMDGSLLGGAAAARRSRALPPASKTRLRRRARAARRAATTSSRSCCRARRSRASASARSALPAWSSPSRRSTAPSLLAGADLVVTAGGTMNREAVVLGTPVYTTFAGRLGGVDERLVGRGPAAAAGLGGRRRGRAQAPAAAERRRRDPDHLLALALTGLAR